MADLLDMASVADYEHATDVLSVGATFTIIEQAGEQLGEVHFADEEIKALQAFPSDLRLELTLRLAEVADLIREALMDLEGRIMQLR